MEIQKPSGKRGLNYQGDLLTTFRMSNDFANIIIFQITSNHFFKKSRNIFKFFKNFIKYMLKSINPQNAKKIRKFFKS